jgi:hypothetical protein
MEHGRVRFKDRDVADLLTLYGITDEKLRARMLASAQDANAPGWWSKYGDLLPDWFEEYLGLEGAASDLELLARRQGQLCRRPGGRRRVGRDVPGCA